MNMRKYIKRVINFDNISLHDYDHKKTSKGIDKYYLAHEYRCEFRFISKARKINNDNKNYKDDNLNENEQGCFSLIYNFNFEKK